MIKTIENALEPHPLHNFKIPGLIRAPQDGFASQRLPELAYVNWEWIRLDNAKAILATETLTALCEFVGCAVSARPKHSPDDRPYIERFSGTIASRLSSRLPGIQARIREIYAGRLPIRKVTFYSCERSRKNCPACHGLSLIASG